VIPDGRLDVSKIQAHWPDPDNRLPVAIHLMDGSVAGDFVGMRNIRRVRRRLRRQTRIMRIAQSSIPHFFHRVG
jgi:hypothetical protein